MSSHSLPSVAAIQVTVWLCGVSQFAIRPVCEHSSCVFLFFFYLMYLCSLILLLFYLKWSSPSTVQDIWHNLPLISRQCCFMPYHRYYLWRVSELEQWLMRCGFILSSFGRDINLKTYIRAMHAVVKTKMSFFHTSLRHPCTLQPLLLNWSDWLMSVVGSCWMSSFINHVKWLASSLGPSLLQSSGDCQTGERKCSHFKRQEHLQSSVELQQCTSVHVDPQPL